MAEPTRFIISWLKDYYKIEAATLVLLPIGADINASVYKVQAVNQKAYFVKLKRRDFQNVNIAILELLQTAGIQQIIPPLKTVEGKYTKRLDNFILIVYPFVQGQDGFSCSLTDQQWITLGRTLRQVHEIKVPASIQTHLHREDFSSKWRDVVRSLYTQAEKVSPSDEVALNLLNFLQKNKPLIQQLVERSEELSRQAQDRPFKLVLCHADIHAGNILIHDRNDFYIVDWDDPLLAPKERDLMFIGGGVGNVWNEPHEEKLFYEGYGQTEIDWPLLAYYRYERIVVDIAEYGQALVLKSTGANRSEMYKQFMGMFEPNGVVDIALETRERG